jgi:hypothetical protein
VDNELLMITMRMTGMATATTIITITGILLEADIPKTTDILIHIVKIEKSIMMTTIMKIEDTMTIGGPHR